MGGMIYDEADNPVCYFSPEVVAIVYTIIAAKEKSIPYIKMRLRFANGDHSEDFTVKLSELDDTNWFDKNIRCRFNPEMSPGKVRRFIADAVRSALPTAPSEDVYFIDRVGVHDINGQKVFCTGGGLIRPPADARDRPKIEVAPMPYNLDIDLNLSEAEAVAGMLELVSLTPNSGRIILAHKLMYIMRSVYMEAWKAPCVCLILHSKTGTQKTTTVTNLIQMYNRVKGIAAPIRLNASIAAAVGVLLENHDDTVILDDLCPAHSNQIRAQQEQTLIEVIRYIGDGTVPARMRGKHISKEPPTCGVVFTAEYVIGEGSDAARLLPVEHTPPDGAKFKYFQDHPLVVSTFYYFYIKWFIENYHDIKELLKEWLTVYRKVNLGVHDRLQETHYFLNTAYTLLLQYCFDRSFITEHDAVKLHRSFIDLLTGLVRAQDERVNQKKGSEPDAVDYLACIRTLYQGNQFTIVDRARLYCDGIHDGVLHNGCLCLRGDRLSEHFPNTSLIEITDSLISQGALQRARTAVPCRSANFAGSGSMLSPLTN